MELVAAALAQEGLWLLIAGALVAGLVRGFSGFGTAMVYLPLAGQVLSPFEALTTLIIMDIFGPLPAVPRALRDGHPGDVLRLAMGMALALPLGVWLLSLIAPEVFRYGVSLITLTLLVMLIAGLRYGGPLRRGLIYGTGAIGGFLAGSVGLPGPPVIMLYMASPHPAPVIRANLMLFLILADLMMIAVLQISGYLVGSAVALGLVLAGPYLLATMVGSALFRPSLEGVYRRVAYAIIALSALSGLPIFD